MFAHNGNKEMKKINRKFVVFIHLVLMLLIPSIVNAEGLNFVANIGMSDFSSGLGGNLEMGLGNNFSVIIGAGYGGNGDLDYAVGGKIYKKFNNSSPYVGLTYCRITGEESY